MRAELVRERLAEASLLVEWPAEVPPQLASVTTDSRKVQSGDLFVAYQGTTSDSHTFLPQVIASGAAAAIVEHLVEGAGIPQILVRNGRQAASYAAAVQFGDPLRSMDMLAVTGTNGKTTSVHLLRHLFGGTAPAGSIGTLGAVDGDGQVIPGTENLTTPGPVELMSTLAALKGRGVKTVAMEASSHSLDQDRLHGVRFKAALFTNLTRDHLDYHQTLDAYLAAKLKLVDYLDEGGWVVTNQDDRAWDSLKKHPHRVSFGITEPADVHAGGISGDARGMRYTMEWKGHRASVSIPLLGRFNIENCLGAAAVALALGKDLGHVAARLAETPQVPGRMERVSEQPCVILRDYAHTPDALTRALAAARPLTRGRLIVVFGCGGDRDRGKRPVMGGIAARDADLAIVTSDNPRTENPERILDDVEEGMGETPHLRIADRRQAIRRAVAIARPDDTVLLAGKGHETYQVIGKEKFPFDERDVVRDAREALAR